MHSTKLPKREASSDPPVEPHTGVIWGQQAPHGPGRCEALAKHKATWKPLQGEAHVLKGHTQDLVIEGIKGLGEVQFHASAAGACKPVSGALNHSSTSTAAPLGFRHRRKAQ